jgi:hypothetical protein
VPDAPDDPEIRPDKVCELAGTFNGYSIGKWIDENGDDRHNVLEVETRGFKGPRNFDQEGIPLHEDQPSIASGPRIPSPFQIDHLTARWSVRNP